MNTPENKTHRNIISQEIHQINKNVSFELVKRLISIWFNLWKNISEWSLVDIEAKIGNKFEIIIYQLD